MRNNFYDNEPAGTEDLKAIDGGRGGNCSEDGSSEDGSSEDEDEGGDGDSNDGDAVVA